MWGTGHVGVECDQKLDWKVFELRGVPAWI